MLGRYLLTLFLTLALEGGIAYLLGLREGRAMLAVVMINVITHLILNYILVVLNYLGVDVSLNLVTILEIPVVLAEWQLLVYVFGSPKGRFFVISLVGNTTSFLVGLLLFW